MREIGFQVDGELWSLFISWIIIKITHRANMNGSMIKIVIEQKSDLLWHPLLWSAITVSSIIAIGDLTGNFHFIRHSRKNALTNYNWIFRRQFMIYQIIQNMYLIITLIEKLHNIVNSMILSPNIKFKITIRAL